MSKIKPAKIVFFFSLVLLITLIVIFIMSQITPKEPTVSLREQYQSELNADK